MAILPLQATGPPPNSPAAHGTDFTPARRIRDAYNPPMGNGPPRWRRILMEWLVRRRGNRRRRPGGRVADAGQPDLLPAARQAPRPICRRTPRRSRSRPRTARASRAGSPAAAPTPAPARHLLRRQRRGGLVHARRPALAARVVDRRAQLSRLRHQRGQAGRTRAHRRCAVDLRRRRGARRHRRETHRDVRAQPRHRAGRARRRGAAGCGRHTGVAVRQPRGHRQPPLPVASGFAAAASTASTPQADATSLPRADAHDRGRQSDSIIPVARSRALYDAWAGPKGWQVVPAPTTTRWAGHADFWDGVTDFSPGY